ncbi:MAG: 4Fe-4S binding protein [Rhodobacteraceae bacterium]|nr:4Fe-4S binding protein [Paracoccaceae bacterium]
MSAKLFLCDCGGTQKLDKDGLEAATGLACSGIATGLCTHQIERLAKAMAEPEAEIIVACQQEAETFEELAADLDVDAPLTVDIRDRAGWSDEGAKATPKMAALLAAAQLRETPAKTIDVASEGLCLILGASDVVLPVADQLSDMLSVTCLLTDTPEVLPAPTRRYDVTAGKLRQAKGAFGGFTVTVDAFRGASPAGRGALAFTDPQDGGSSECDIILDLTGNPALFPAHEKRDGYLRADPGDPVAVQRAAMEASHLVGTFEKTLHIRIDESLCAHSRAGQTGCTRCLDLCPTGAILPAGDHVEIDPNICAGCGACSSACPSGAVAYDDPPVTALFARIRTLASAYREAGGKTPRLLVHDATHGREMISLSARLGRGLPADVIPLEVAALGTFGHAEMMVALASGFARIDLLLSPRTERDALQAELDLAIALTEGLGAGEGRLAFLDVADPDAMSDALYAAKTTPIKSEPVLPLGHRRDATRLAAKALAGGKAIDPIELPKGAPYGAVLVNEDACTLCLSCASLCPSGALGDNPDKPELTFKEDACLQCGLCTNICPENAIALQPRLDISDDAFTTRVLKEEEPYDCIECGKPFGVKSTVERIVAKLENAHSMFTNSDNTRLIRMCDDCRIKAQYHNASAPFQMGERPKVRTTDDYLDPSKKH